MRYLFVTDNGVIDSCSGEVLELDQLERVMLERPGGVIAGNNLYPVLSQLIPMIKMDIGWTATLKLQKKKKPKSGRVGGSIYFTRMTYRFPKERYLGTRFRPGAIKWLILNLELFHETDDIQGSARALVELAAMRGIRPRDSPGSFGGALLRASPEWQKGRTPAPWFISEQARMHLPGNYYVLRDGYHLKSVKSAYYIDQQSSHHTVASTIPLPDPRYLRARGRLRSVERGEYPEWINRENMNMLDGHTGLLCASVDCSLIPRTLEHLYPPWAKIPGKHIAWIWTSDLRLFDEWVKLEYVSCALTSHKMDAALFEFANWSLDYLSQHKHPAIKAALLAAYGLLGVKSDGRIEKYSISGRPIPPRSETVNLPLLGEVYRTTVVNTRVSAIQNVVARGVIEAETRTRSIEYARDLEANGFKVSQIYADGLIVDSDHCPYVPRYWRVVGALTNVRSPTANTIHSNEMTRTPGIPSGRREIKIKEDIW